MSKNIIQKGFILAGLINILGVLIFTKLFTNQVVFETDPIVMSSFGMVMIMVWGLAYIAISKDYEKVPWLVGVFILEKFVYVFVWAKWLMQNEISAVYEQDLLAGIFYSIYGANDLLFMAFFAVVYLKVRNS